jgi:hypothetical protein
MITHVAPRCVTVISDLNGESGIQQLALDNVLGVDLSDDKPGQLTLVVHLVTGKRVIAGRYSDPAVAGADFGKLRILLGFPAWPEEWQHDGDARTPSNTEAGGPPIWRSTRRAVAIICTMAAVLGCVVLGSTG